jgi:hypothetical protein
MWSLSCSIDVFAPFVGRLHRGRSQTYFPVFEIKLKILINGNDKNIPPCSVDIEHVEEDAGGNVSVSNRAKK